MSIIETSLFTGLCGIYVGSRGDSSLQINYPISHNDIIPEVKDFSFDFSDKVTGSFKLVGSDVGINNNKITNFLDYTIPYTFVLHPDEKFTSDDILIYNYQAYLPMYIEKEKKKIPENYKVICYRMITP